MKFVIELFKVFSLGSIVFLKGILTLWAKLLLFIEYKVLVKLSSLLKVELTSGAVTEAPSKQGSTASPKIHNLENIASFIMKKSIPVLLSVDQ